jgi:hypothetical protein
VGSHEIDTPLARDAFVSRQEARGSRGDPSATSWQRAHLTAAIALSSARAADPLHKRGRFVAIGGHSRSASAPLSGGRFFGTFVVGLFFSRMSNCSLAATPLPLLSRSRERR